MDCRISERVGAFIIRKNAQNLYELLLFKHPDCEETPIQIPGGGVDEGETIEAALHREIHEESGLTSLTIVRKLGIAERCWLNTKNINRRHCFLLETTEKTPDRWDHIVFGGGYDSGMCFSYFWHRPAIDFQLHEEWNQFLSPQALPELYEALKANC